ncbi:GntR family transcriptional regulator [Pararobbsia silviterrae]|uniref:GntR family transcriptional regulator n=1 Tax=Pararobbsia silviterrae TaxID=1792498 RepID=A0A494Y463_9BURK|nr:GntR family transcriptional regulator [Pararobbsia silviterrae]RKP54686.1 GntR family transcriptional regulator [Pararobbsia silviterrae]
MGKARHAAATLYDRIRDALHARILDGTYPPGSRLPTEHALCESHGVSRITIRQALERLRQEGWVEKIHGQGTFVQRSRAVQNVSALQSFSEAMTPFGHRVSNRVESARIVEANSQLLDRLRLDAQAQVTEIQRVRMLDGAAVSFEVTYAAHEIGAQLLIADLANRDIFHVIEQDCGVRIGHADLSIRSMPASGAVASGLEVEPGSSLLCIERVVYSRDGAPVLFEALHYRGDAFQYQLRIERAKR